ncbi:F4 family fimbrial subunit [Citrobacter freundii]|uniref:F4 family fimbrial subunit n=1 Tax=Citrobacter freundii TaxID=546 RepID=UPI00383AC946
MKKTLIALAVAASAAVSGSALAGLGSFGSGNINNTVNFGGSITVPEGANSWVWAVGQGYDQYSNTTRDLTDNGTKLTITASENMPLLVGKTMKPFEGAPGLAPQIAFSDSKGVITPVWGTSNAEGTMTLTVNDASQQKIGTMTLNVTGISPVVWARTSGSSSADVRVQDPTGGAFLNATGNFESSPSFTEVDAILTSFGGTTIQELQTLLKTYPGLSNIAEDTSNVAGRTQDPLASSGWAYVSSYALGILRGKTLEVNFDSTVNHDTQWKAPLNMQISYN